MRQITAALAISGLLAAVTGCSGPVPGLTYASLVQEIEAGNVSEVEISSGRVVVTLKAAIPVERSEQELDGALVYQVGLPADEETQEELIDLLIDHEVPFSVEE